MNDKELLINAISEFGSSIGSKLLGINFSQATQAMFKMGLNNLISKQKYSIMLDMLFDEEGNLLSKDDFWKTFKDILNQKPLEFMGIRFNGSDIDEIQSIYNKHKQ